MSEKEKELRLALEEVYEWYCKACGEGHADWTADWKDVERIQLLIGNERSKVIEESGRCKFYDEEV